MSVGLYDKSLVEKISNWISDPNMVITGPDETRRLFSYRADIKSDQPIQLPLIAIRRGKSVDILRTGKKPATFDGITLQANDKTVVSLQEIPISIPYQIDIYTRHLAEADEYLRNFVFNIINYPQLEITIPYQNVGISHVANIRMASQVEDNSDIPERLIQGQFTRYTISLVIDDAHFWSVPMRQAFKVESQVEVL